MTPLGEQIHCSLEIFEQIEVNIVEIHMKFRMEYEEKKIKCELTSFSFTGNGMCLDRYSTRRGGTNFPN